jgi:N4-(beta-N-acetylglucosaminyl)-L-asparaginase
MHGPSRSAGSVGGVRNIKNVCLVARKVYEHTGHVMLVAEGAQRFASRPGLPQRGPPHRRRPQNLDALEGEQLADGLVGPVDEPVWLEGSLRRTGPRPSRAWICMGSRLCARIRRSRPLHCAPVRYRVTPHPSGLKPFASAPGASSTWLPISASPRKTASAAAEQILWPTTGTIHVSVVNPKGERSPARPPPPAWPGSLPAAWATRRSSAPAATPIRTWARQAPPVPVKKTSRSPARTPSSS